MTPSEKFALRSECAKRAAETRKENRTMPQPTYEQMAEVLSYCPETGHLRWKVKPARCVRKGAIAGRKTDKYIAVMVFGRCHIASRIAWLLTHKEWPKNMIDHRNGDTHDNRLCNLREATNSQNQANRRTHPMKGCRQIHNGRWRAYIRKDNRYIHLGYYADAGGAKAAYRMAAEKMFGAYAEHLR